MAVADWQCQVLTSARVDLDRTARPIDLLHDELHRQLEGLGVERLEELVVGVIGSVDPYGTPRLNQTIPELSQPGYFTPLGGLAEHFRLENDAALAAAAEYAHHTAPLPSLMVALLIDASVGSGLVIDGRVLRGEAGYSGEVSYLPGSGWSTAHLILLEAATDHDVTVRELFEHAGHGEHAHEWARTAVTRFARAIAPGVIALVATLDPEVIVVGGDGSAAGGLICQILRDEVAECCPHVPRFQVSELGRTSIIQGALAMARANLGTDPQGH
ncbi:ROK family protein [Luteococcus sp. OSA5]|uniref:ROK family protein n=1 Tax=Luteococcus sp. OSA5 TaxID=3401630 RepID=UPI003B43A23A